MTTLADRYDVALLDLDGVVYVGEKAITHAPEALRAARAAGMRLAFVTNNAARPADVVAGHLRDLGVAASTDEVVTSAQAAAGLLADQLPAGAAVLVVGGEGLEVALRERGLRPVASLADRPAAVVQGFHPDVGWRLLAEGSYAVASGLPWIASNADRTIPTPRGTAPGNGTLVDAIRAATGRDPVVAGKPEPPMHEEALRRSAARQPLVVGDRLDTDIEGANRVGADSLLVLTGVTAPVDLVLAPPAHRPTYVGHDLRALVTPAHDLRVDSGAATRSRWRARIEADRLVIEATAPPGTAGRIEDRLDPLRAACGAVWSAARSELDADSVAGALDGPFGAVP